MSINAAAPKAGFSSELALEQKLVTKQDPPRFERGIRLPKNKLGVGNLAEQLKFSMYLLNSTK